MEVGGEVQGDVCARRLRRRRLREKKKKSWKDRGVRGLEGEGGSKYMKMVVRETIASATLEKGGGLFKAQLTQAQSFNNNNQPSRPTKSITKKLSKSIPACWECPRCSEVPKLKLILIEKASTSVLLALLFGLPSGLSSS